jgi:hypothetical protein
MPPNRYRGPPMTLANMRENGVRSLSVTCELCHHEAVMKVDAFDDTVPVPAFGPRMVCTVCGIIGAFARPNWQKRAEQESTTGRQWRRR